MFRVLKMQHVISATPYQLIFEWLNQQLGTTATGFFKC